MPEQGVNRFGEKTTVAGPEFFPVAVKKIRQPSVRRLRTVLNLFPNLGGGFKLRMKESGINPFQSEKGQAFECRSPRAGRFRWRDEMSRS